jgi:hypothetical protein
MGHDFLRSRVILPAVGLLALAGTPQAIAQTQGNCGILALGIRAGVQAELTSVEQVKQLAQQQAKLAALITSLSLRHVALAESDIATLKDISNELNAVSNALVQDQNESIPKIAAAGDVFSAVCH